MRGHRTGVSRSVSRWAALAVAVAAFVADRAAEQWVLMHLMPDQAVVVWRPVLWLVLTENRGAAFGLLTESRDLLVAVAVVVIGGIGGFLARTPRMTPTLAVGLGLVLGGAAGNLWDRLVAGRVVDYIDFRFWPVFNVADSAIVVGMALLLWEAWRRERGPA
jgi:signal peptidase II